MEECNFKKLHFNYTLLSTLFTLFVKSVIKGGIIIDYTLFSTLIISINYFYTLTPLFLRQCKLRWTDKRLHSYFHPYIKYQLFLHSYTPIFKTV